MEIDIIGLISACSYALDCIEAELVNIKNKHGKRVAYISVRMGQYFDLPEDALQDLAICALLHDNALTQYISEELQEHSAADLTADLVANTTNLHCIYGEQNLVKIPFKTDVTNAILYHHEHADGTGPFHKKWDEVPLSARIIHLADVVEIGCVGSRNADMGFFEDARFVIEPDRRGYEDLITNISYTSLCSDEFLKDIGFNAFGYQEEFGMMTDVLELKEKGLKVSCLNLSCGYYEPHTDHEFTVKKDLLNCLGLVEHIIENCLSVYPHENLESGYYHRYFEIDAETEIWDILSWDPEMSVEDLYEMYQTNYPRLKKEDFERIYNEYHEFNDEEELWKDTNLKGAVNTKRLWL